MPNTLDGKKFSKYFLLIMCTISLLFFLDLIKIFIIQIILAIVLAIIIYPIFKFILKKFTKNRNIASILCCLLILFLILVPLIFLFNVFIAQITNLYHTASESVNGSVQKFDSNKIQNILNSVVGKWLPTKDIVIDWDAFIVKFVSFSSLQLSHILNKSYKLTLNFIFDFSIIMFSLFYFLRDGETFLLKIKEIIPISEEYKNRIILKFYLMTNATIKGVFLISILQGFMAVLILFLFGIPNWLLLGLITLVLSVIPFLGTGIILVPTGIITILNGHTYKGIAIIILSVCFISLIDNILRPRLIGEQTGMHDLLIFFSIIGGLFSFGSAGLIIGPLIAAIFLTIVQIYKIEFLALPGEES